METQPFVTKDPRSDYFLIGLTITENTLGWLFFVARIVCVRGESGSNKPSPQSSLQIKQLFSFEKGKCYRPYHVVGFERRFLTPPTLVFLVKSCILI